MRGLVMTTLLFASVCGFAQERIRAEIANPKSEQELVRNLSVQAPAGQRRVASAVCFR
jgi:hypothetical protein